MNRYWRSALLGLVFTLSACQTADQIFGVYLGPEGETPVVPVPPVAETPTAAPEEVTTETLVSDLRIYAGSVQAHAGYTPLAQKGQRVYLHPSDYLVLSDLIDAIAVVDEHNRPYVNLEFSPEGFARLQQISHTHLGKELVVTFKGELVSIINITQVPSQPTLHVPMHSLEEAKRFETLILDGE